MQEKSEKANKNRLGGRFFTNFQFPIPSYINLFLRTSYIRPSYFLPPFLLPSLFSAQVVRPVFFLSPLSPPWSLGLSTFDFRLSTFNFQLSKDSLRTLYGLFTDSFAGLDAELFVSMLFSGSTNFQNAAILPLLASASSIDCACAIRECFFLYL